MYRCKQMLLVSGPSGAGKSTFIKQMRRNRLPENIRSHLTPYADETIQVLDMTNVLRRRIEQDGLPDTLATLDLSDRLILHYDITSIHRFGLENYEDDRGLEFLELAKHLQIVLVKPDQNKLLSQFSGRSQQRERKKSTSKKIWKKLIQTPIRRVRSTIAGRAFTPEKDLYRDKKWLANCYHQWLDFLSAKTDEQTASHILVLEPCLDPQGAHSFCQTNEGE